MTTASRRHIGQKLVVIGVAADPGIFLEDVDEVFRWVADGDDLDIGVRS